MKKRKLITGLERVNKCNNEVRPLTERETPLNTRKGMKRVQTTVNINWMQQQQRLKLL